MVFGVLGHPGWALPAFGVVVAAVSALTTVPAALGTAATLWAMDTGFVIGGFGQLAVNRVSAQAAGVLLGTAVLSLGVAAAVRAVRAPRQLTPLMVPTGHRSLG